MFWLLEILAPLTSALGPRVLESISTDYIFVGECLLGTPLVFSQFPFLFFNQINLIEKKRKKEAASTRIKEVQLPVMNKKKTANRS